MVIFTVVPYSSVSFLAGIGGSKRSKIWANHSAETSWARSTMNRSAPMAISLRCSGTKDATMLQRGPANDDNGYLREPSATSSRVSAPNSVGATTHRALISPEQRSSNGRRPWNSRCAWEDVLIGVFLRCTQRTNRKLYYRTDEERGLFFHCHER